MLAGVALLALGYCAHREPGETVVVTRVDTVPYSQFRDSLKHERLEAEGLRAKLAGRSTLEPRTILRTDTLVTPPDTVVQSIRLYANGGLSLAPLIHADSLYRPELHRFDVSACDDGFAWNAGVLVCDKARLGHLYVYARQGLDTGFPFRREDFMGAPTEAGIEWTASYRSGWRVSTALARDGRTSLAITLR